MEEVLNMLWGTAVFFFYKVLKNIILLTFPALLIMTTSEPRSTGIPREAEGEEDRETSGGLRSLAKLLCQ